MISYKCFIYFTVLISVSTQIHAACVCNEKGSDYCAGCSERLVVKPKPKYPAEINLPPVGDSCWCSKMMIQPALLPKPCSKNKPPPPVPCSCKESGSYSSSSPPSSYDPLPSIFSSSSSSGSYIVPQANYVSTVPKDDSLPADPVSVSLAIQSGKAIEVPEAKLAYGFVQNPIDGMPKVYISSVNEEKLYALKSDVITLKKPEKPQKPVEDYPDAEDEETHGGAYEEEEPPRLTYRQLGYAAEQYKNPQFREIGSSYSYTSSTGYSQPYAVQGKVAADCGYKPGRIAKYGRTKNYADSYN